MMNQNLKTTTVKVGHLPIKVAATAFVAINQERGNQVKLVDHPDYGQWFICSSVDPNKLVYPKGFEYCGTNFRECSTGPTQGYTMAPILKSYGTEWTRWGCRDRNSREQLDSREFSVVSAMLTMAALNKAKVINPITVRFRGGNMIKLLEGWSLESVDDNNYYIACGDKKFIALFA